MTGITKIALIGSGLSGTLTAINLLWREVPVHISVYEQEQEQVNRGAAYRQNNIYQPLNVPIERMSAFSNQPDHFYHWLREDEKRMAGCFYGVELDCFVPRKIFGDYLKDIFAKTIAEAKGLHVINVISESAISVIPSNDGYNVNTANGTAHYSKVVLASGNVPPQKAIFLPPHCRDLELPIVHSWKGLPKIDSRKQVLIVGSGLSMVDAIIELDRQGFNGHIRVLSRHGLIPLPEIPEPHNHLTLPLNESAYEQLKAFRALAKEAEAHGSGWRTIFHNIRPQIPALWQVLSLEEKQRFLRHVQPYWEIHRHRVPEFSYRLIQNLIAGGRLQLLKGRITDIANSTHGKATVTYRPRHTQASVNFNTDLIVNCTGPLTDLSKSGDPLLEQLIKSGTATTGPLKMGLETNEFGELINGLGHVQTGLFAIGSLRKGNLWETTALREIRQQAEAIPELLLRKRVLVVE
ncbi:FAD/NAD(P)-binding domain-containing protein [soil metagenome]